MGYEAGFNTMTGSSNIIFGHQAGYGYPGESFSYTMAIGYQAGYSLRAGSADNIFVGFKAGYNVATGTGNIVIGYDTGASAPEASNELNIGGLLYGDLSAKMIGISTRVPQAALDIVSTGTASDIYAQIWRDSGGVIRASMTSEGTLYATAGMPPTGAAGGALAGTYPNPGLATAQTAAAAWSGAQTFNGGAAFPGSGIWNTSGDVGIGTASPGQRLHLYSASGDAAVRFQTQAAEAGSSGPNNGGTFANDATVGNWSWSNTSDAQFDDSYYSTALLWDPSPYRSNYLKATNFGFNIPSDATVVGILIDVKRRTSGFAMVYDYSAKIVKGGVITGAEKKDLVTVWPGQDDEPAYNSYGGSGDLWGVGWTPADINSSGFGFVISGYAPQIKYLYVGHIRITVYYTVPVGVNWTMGGDYSESGIFKIAGSDALGSSDHVTINNSGYVGIGTTNPGARLEVAGQIKITGGSPGAGKVLASDASGLASWVTPGDNLGDHTATTALNMTGFNMIGVSTITVSSITTASAGVTISTNIYVNGSLGIGTTVPGHKVDVAGTIYSRRYAAAADIDWNNGNTQSLTLTAVPTTLTFANGRDGGKYFLILKQDGTGSRTVTWPAEVRFPGGTAPVLTTTAGKTDYVSFIYNGVDSKYDAVAFMKDL